MFLFLQTLLPLSPPILDLCTYAKCQVHQTFLIPMKTELSFPWVLKPYCTIPFFSLTHTLSCDDSPQIVLTNHSPSFIPVLARHSRYSLLGAFISGEAFGGKGKEP